MTVIDEAIEVLEQFPVDRLAPASHFDIVVNGVVCVCPAMILAEHFGFDAQPTNAVLEQLGRLLSPDPDASPGRLETWTWNTIVRPYDIAYDRVFINAIDLIEHPGAFLNQCREAGRKATIDALRREAAVTV